MTDYEIVLKHKLEAWDNYCHAPSREKRIYWGDRYVRLAGLLDYMEKGVVYNDTSS